MSVSSNGAAADPARPPAGRLTARVGALLVVLALVAAACGGSGDAAADTTTTTASTTTAPTTTTTAPTTTTTEATTTTVDPALIAPLTGLAVADAADLARPALVVKIDNHPNARPQTGLDQADIVFDLRAEGVTRFTAVFHSRIPDPVGPVRSSRTSDFDLLWGFNNPLYASSGGNDNVMSALRGVDAIAVTNATRLEYFRNSSRPAPHNLYVNASDLYALAPDDAGPPFPWFDYRAADQELPTTAAPFDGELSVAFRDGPPAGFTWDADTGTWPRTQSGQPHLTAEGVQLAPHNVVVMVTTYVRSPADASSPELVSTGSGELVVLTDGHRIDGTWERAAPTDRPILLDGAGDPIVLTPGQTWVLYPEAGQIR